MQTRNYWRVLCVSVIVLIYVQKLFFFSCVVVSSLSLVESLRLTPSRIEINFYSMSKKRCNRFASTKSDVHKNRTLNK